MRRIATITDVAERHLCSGCGACAAMSPAITMIDVPSEGLRPVVTDDNADRAALSVCPGVALTHDPFPAGHDKNLAPAWGPVLAIWEGHASDPELRHAASSGGAATVIATHTIDSMGFQGVVHVGARADEPWRNETVHSTTAAELRQHTGSRYAPASPAEGLDKLATADSPWTFIGKPCDVAGARAVGRARRDIGQNLGLTIAIFCAGTPSTNGTIEMMEKMGKQSGDEVVSVRYRGNGWPGMAATVVARDGKEIRNEMSYSDSWGGILQRHRPWRCRICPDHTGEFADVSVGDPWYRPTDGNAGSSLIIARTERGRAAIESAIAAGVLEAHLVDHSLLPASQPNLEHVRGGVFGRLLGMRMAAMTTPKFKGLPMAEIWLRRLSAVEKIKSVAGTVKRVRGRGLRNPSEAYRKAAKEAKADLQ